MRFIHMLGGKNGVFCVTDFPETISFDEVKKRLEKFFKNDWEKYSDAPIVLLNEDCMRENDLEGKSLLETGVLYWNSKDMKKREEARKSFIRRIKETGYFI